PFARSAKSAMSLPAVKASPSALKRTTRTLFSVCALSKASRAARYIALERAFFFSGRAKVISSTPSFSLSLICSLILDSAEIGHEEFRSADHALYRSQEELLFDDYSDSINIRAT